MNKKLFFVFAYMAILVLNASAQFSNSGNNSIPVNDYKGWNTIFFEWNPSSFVYTGKEDVDDVNFNGFSFGYNRAISLISSVPLFLETGIAVQFSLHKEDESKSYYKLSEKLSLVSLKVPVNLMYKVNLPNSSISFVPFAGFTIRGNVWGEDYYKAKYDGNSESVSLDLFDKDDMNKLNSNTWKRIQIGWQVGLKAHFAERIVLGGSFGTDFSEIVKKSKVHTGTVSIGYTF